MSRRIFLTALAAAVLAGCAKGLPTTATTALKGAFGAKAAETLAAPFPGGFFWGVATAGHQIEGGDRTSNWAAWEKAGRVPQPIGKAIDHWNRYEEDLDLAKALGLNSFRLSLEWAKIEPRKGELDAAAVKHYHDVIAACHARGLEPIVTVLHFSYPAWLDEPDAQKRTGWESAEMPAQFARFAGWAAGEYGREVKWWLTINEPNTYAMVGYLAGMMPPGKRNPWAYTAVMANLSRAHKLGYDAIHAADAEAMVSINPIIVHARPDDPVYPPGTAPELAPESIPMPPVNGGFYTDETTFLDQFVARPGTKDRSYLDYNAFNYFYAVKLHEMTQIANYGKWPIYPDGMYQVAKKLYGRYKLPLMVTENGMPTVSDNPRADGWTREAHLVNHLAHLKRAMDEGVPVLGYMHWTLADNYEWGSYEPKFGLYGIDRRDPELRRFRTGAADVYQAIATGNRLTEVLLGRYGGKRS